MSAGGETSELRGGRRQRGRERRPTGEVEGKHSSILFTTLHPIFDALPFLSTCMLRQMLLDCVSVENTEGGRSAPEVKISRAIPYFYLRFYIFGEQKQISPGEGRSENELYRQSAQKQRVSLRGRGGISTTRHVD